VVLQNSADDPFLICGQRKPQLRELVAKQRSEGVEILKDLLTDERRIVVQELYE
jgi:hypothetical protein